MEGLSNLDFLTSPEEIADLEDKVAEYEEIYEEIQNFEISEKALDKIEEVLDENIQLKQSNWEMMKTIEDLQASLDAHNLKSINESLKKKTESSNMVLEELKTNIQETPFLNTQKRPPPPPPPPPKTIQNIALITIEKPKYRVLFWNKLNDIGKTIFEYPTKFNIKQASLNKFPFVTSKVLNTSNLPLMNSRHKILDHKREIAVSSVLRSLGMPPETIIKKLNECSSDLIDDIDRIKALIRILPTNDECLSLRTMAENSFPLSPNESFLYSISQIQNFKYFFDCIYYKLNFSTTIEELLFCFKNWKTLCTKLIQNKRLQHFIHLILSFGNELNCSHPKYGNASGFHIGFLNELGNIKSPIENSSLLDILAEEFCFQYGNPHIFYSSEHTLLKNVASSSYKALLDSHESFFKEYCCMSSIESSQECEKIIRNFVGIKRKDVENELEAFDDMKNCVKEVHRYFAVEEIMDDEGRLEVFCVVERFYEKYLECVKKKWANLTNRDSKIFRIPIDRRLSRGVKENN
ncbi:hypothetical protein SteCoe_17135 [Stentor coeruleus]|uniref:FH2 domain-containing protein n=1 Tax=Stentor coeruleus TaxID=5963 RepID=A0A1R2BZR8_9CILI|nr:hypothetical protein SteCoe_17135 [Stentor coeruleus]